MVGLCRFEIRNSNQKSLPILGLLPTSSRREQSAAARLAEGEKLGSNILRLREFEDVPKGTDSPRNPHSACCGRSCLLGQGARLRAQVTGPGLNRTARHSADR